MSKPRPGTQLEGAVQLAADQYRRQGRADIRKADAKSIFVRGQQIWTKRGDSDFVGDENGRGWRGECKETHEASLPLANIEEHQRETLAAAVARGCTAGLIIAFLPSWSCWWLPWAEVAQFLPDDKRWRESISLDMCKAFGLELPVDCRPSQRQKGRLVRHVRFLDGGAHPDKDGAIARVNAERLAARARKEADEASDRIGRRIQQLTLGGQEHDLPVEIEVAPFDPFASAALAKFGRKHGVKAKNWGEK